MTDTAQTKQLLGPLNPSVRSRGGPLSPQAQSPDAGPRTLSRRAFLRVRDAARQHLRLLLWLAGGAFAAYLLLPRAGELREGFGALSTIGWEWLAAGVAAAAMTYPMAAWAQIGAVDRPLPFGRTALVQVAAVFISQLTPQGVGGMGLNARYLERQGLDRPAAVGAVALNMVAGVVMHILALMFVITIAGSEVTGQARIPIGWSVAIAIAVVVALGALVLYTPVGRRRVVAPVVPMVRNVLSVLRRPVRALQLFGGSAGVTGAHSLALAVSVAAFSPGASPLQVAAVYLGGAAVGSLVPTPGGLGALEAALVAGLTAIGVELVPAVAAVSAFRLLTFWLPILPGFVAFRYLRSQQIV